MLPLCSAGIWRHFSLKGTRVSKKQKRFYSINCPGMYLKVWWHVNYRDCKQCPVKTGRIGWQSSDVTEAACAYNSAGYSFRQSSNVQSDRISLCTSNLSISCCCFENVQYKYHWCSCYFKRVQLQCRGKKSLFICITGTAVLWKLANKAYRLNFAPSCFLESILNCTLFVNPFLS